MLYIVGTPIGNLGDLSKRVIEILTNADIIFAEDTRTAMQLLNSQNIKNSIKSCHKDNETNAVKEIIDLLLQDKKIALISEAGMPCISDPGHIVVKSAIENNIPIEIAQGPTALIHGLIASGFSGSSFYFHGFLPHNKTDKENALKHIKNTISAPVIFYEAPHRLKETILLILKYFEPPVSVTKEATKKFEQTFFINSIDDLEHINIKGEFIIVINNTVEKKDNNVDFVNTVNELLKENFSNKDILKILKILGMKRNQAYDLINTLSSK